jgi:predicted signal transduction protein with EAL and GGDEF domain
MTDSITLVKYADIWSYSEVLFFEVVSIFAGLFCLAVVR